MKVNETTQSQKRYYTYRYSCFDQTGQLCKNNITECETLDILKSRLKAEKVAFDVIEILHGEKWEQIFPPSVSDLLKEQSRKQIKVAKVCATISLACFVLAIWLLKQKD